MDIKEIALKHAREYLTFKLGDRKGLDVEEIVCDDEIYKEIVDELAQQFEAFIAELAKGNEDIGAIQNGKFQWNTDGGPEKWRARKEFSGKLYTFPPTAEQIANETSWQPIETAPKGERFLTTTKLSNGSFGQVGISHSFFCYEVNTRDWKIAGDDPCATHWMPLPTLPKRSMEGV